jgi:hypothetical protein
MSFGKPSTAGAAQAGRKILLPVEDPARFPGGVSQMTHFLRYRCKSCGIVRTAAVIPGTEKTTCPPCSAKPESARSILLKRLIGFAVFCAMLALFIWKGHTILFYAMWFGLAALYAMCGADRNW